MPATPAMASRLVEYLCPAGHVVTRATQDVTYLGSPKRRCPACGAETIVPQYCEWADMTPAQREATMRRCVLSTIFAGSGIGAALLLATVIAGVIAKLPYDTLFILGELAYITGVGSMAAVHVLRLHQSLTRTSGEAG